MVAKRLLYACDDQVGGRRTGWYEDTKGGGRFCNFITRFIVHRNSPVIRIYHTWVFTGDGNRDRIRNMGWRLD